MNAIIFSKDRALQLHCLLESIYDNCPIFDNITVQYQTKFYEGYELVKLHFPEVKFVREKDFKFTFLANIINGLNCLLVDDDIIFRKTTKSEVLEMMEECEIGSLRLGNNIKKQHHFHVKSSVDGNIFPDTVLRQMLHEQFDNPNGLESKLLKYCQEMTMAWFNESRLIGIPNNRVSKTSGCHHMGGDVKELDDMYCDGYRIDYKAMDFDCDNVHLETVFKINNKI